MERKELCMQIRLNGKCNLKLCNYYHPQEKFTKNDVNNLCHDYNLNGNCKRKNKCKFSHDGQPNFTCNFKKPKFCNICKNNKDTEDSKPKPQCHSYHLKGKCEKQDCKYSHMGKPQNKCVFFNPLECQICLKTKAKTQTKNNNINGKINPKICHDYNKFGECQKELCKFEHKGQRNGQCTFKNSDMCRKCNPKCHFYEKRGKCKRGKHCKFAQYHQGKPMRKCPYNYAKCIFCQYNRQILGPCHNYHLNNGNCKKKSENKCRHSHYGAPAGKCINQFCQIENCINFTKKDNKSNKNQKYYQKIVDKINDPDIYTDQIKAAEQVEDIKVMKNMEKRDESKDQLAKYSFFDHQINKDDKNKELQKIIQTRQIAKQSIGNNYIATKESKKVFIKGEGEFFSANGQKGVVKAQENKIEVIVNDKKIHEYRSNKGQLANVLLKKDNYFDIQNKKNDYQNDSQSQSDAIDSDDDFFNDNIKFKNQNKNNQLHEQNLILLDYPLNVPVTGNFLLSNKKDDFKNASVVTKNDDTQKLVVQSLKKTNQSISQLSKQYSAQQIKKIRKKCMLQICFVLDTTGSMDPYINESKNTMINIINQVSEQVQEDLFEIYFSVVCYRDHCDEQSSYLVKHFDFDKNINNIISKINTLDADGGGDTAEAMADGLNEVFKLDWSKGDNNAGGCQRIVFQIGDAPPHGVDSNVSDNYPKGCPCKLQLSNIIKKLNSWDISFNMIAIGSKLEKTEQLFSNQVQSFNFRNIQNASTMTENIIEILKQYPFWEAGS